MISFLEVVNRQCEDEAYMFLYVIKVWYIGQDLLSVIVLTIETDWSIYNGIWNLFSQ